MFMRRAIISAVLLVAVITTAQAATSPVEMLRDMFRTPPTEWRDILRSSKPILDPEFFKNVEKRVRWGLENNHIDDAFRFAMVGDFASEVKNQPANFRIDMAEMFFKAGNQTMTGQIVENIIVTSPNTEPAVKAKYLKAQLLELQKDMFAAHGLYVDLAKKGYEPSQTWYKAALVSMYIQEEKRALDEFKLAEKSGNLQAGIERQKLENILTGTDFNKDIIAPIPNSSTTDTTGVESVAKADKTKMLSSAQAALDAGRLEDAKAEYLAAYRAFPADIEVARARAAVLYRLGELEEARAFLDASLARYSEDVELLRYRANVLERMYDREQNPQMLELALEDYKLARKLSPNHRFVPMELQRASAKK